MVVGEFGRDVDLLVVGGGPGGYAAAIRAAQLGKKVTLVEKEKLGGVCLNRGCIPSKALIEAATLYHKVQRAESMGITVSNVKLHLGQVQQWKNGIVEQLTSGVESLLQRNGVEVLQGEVYFTAANEARVISGYENERLRFNHCIIATGARPAELKAFPFDEQYILSSTGALNLEEVPEQLVVIGGGYIGVELGSCFGKMGSQVTIVEATPTLLPGFDKAMVQMVSRALKKRGVTIYTQALAQEYEVRDGKVHLTLSVQGQQQELTADKVLVAVGRRPNTEELGLEHIGIQLDERGFIQVGKNMQTSIPHIYAIGDVAGEPMLAHKAYYEAKVAAASIAGQPAEVDYLAMPFVIFSDPEMASVGLTKEQAQEKGYEVLTARFPFQANGRALTLHQPDGFAHLVADKATGVVLGAQLVGADSSSLISELALAIEMGTTLEDLELTVHPHPTLSETIVEAAEVALGRGLHLFSK